jgi:hypothetical protein
MKAQSEVTAIYLDKGECEPLRQEINKLFALTTIESLLKIAEQFPHTLALKQALDTERREEENQ